MIQTIMILDERQQRHPRRSGLSIHLLALVSLLALPLKAAPRAHAEEPDEASRQSWANELPDLPDREAIARLTELRTRGPESVVATEALLEIWRQSDGERDDDVLAAVLDVFREMGKAGALAGESLSDFLRHDFQGYWGRDRLEIIRLRSYLMITLGEIGLPTAAYPHFLDSLAHSDDRGVAVEMGSAARALRSSGVEVREFIPYLTELIPKPRAEEEFSLARYSVDFPDEEATTAQLEAIRTLSIFCLPGDEEAFGLLQRLASVPEGSRWDPRAVHEAKQALETIRGRASAPSPPERSPSWLTVRNSTSNVTLEVGYTNQEGREGLLRELVDRPTLITFFYTRCQNNAKCSAALSQFAALQTALRQLALENEVRLIAISHEPAYDDPTRLKRFASNRGFEFTETAQALKLDEQSHESFVKALTVPVSFNGGAVNTHGVGLYLLDAEGQLVCQYHTLLWENAQVIQDVRRLLGKATRSN